MARAVALTRLWGLLPPVVVRQGLGRLDAQGLRHRLARVDVVPAQGVGHPDATAPEPGGTARPAPTRPPALRHSPRRPPPPPGPSGRWARGGRPATLPLGVGTVRDLADADQDRRGGVDRHGPPSVPGRHPPGRSPSVHSGDAHRRRLGPCGVRPEVRRRQAPGRCRSRGHRPGHRLADVPVDYPVFGLAVGRAVAEGRADRGSASAERASASPSPPTRSTASGPRLVHDVTTAGLARRHNDANVICLGGRTTGAGRGARRRGRLLRHRPSRAVATSLGWTRSARHARPAARSSRVVSCRRAAQRRTDAPEGRSRP